MSENIVAFQKLRKNKETMRCSSVLVQCDNFRCLAYRDDDGKWRNYFNDDELRGAVKEILPN